MKLETFFDVKEWIESHIEIEGGGGEVSHHLFFPLRKKSIFVVPGANPINLFVFDKTLLLFLDFLDGILLQS